MISVDHPAMVARRPAWCVQHGYRPVEGCRACTQRGLPAPHHALHMDAPHSADQMRELWDGWFERMGPNEFVGWEAAFRAYWKAITTEGTKTDPVAAASDAYYAWEDLAGGDLLHYLNGSPRDRD